VTVTTTAPTLRAEASAVGAPPGPGSIPARLHEWVLARPGAVAVRDPSEALTYRELWDASGRAAAGLARHGVGVDDVVEVALEPGTTAVASMLGALRLGAAVAAVDPRWPARRRDQLAERLSPVVSVGADGTGTTLATDLLAGAPMPETAAPVDAAATAAVFFTSGSSGEPKLVASPHHALTRLTGAGRTLFPEPGAVMLQASRPGWDVLSLETWAPLCAGGTTHVIRGGVFPDALVAAVAAGVDHAWITSSVLNLLVDEDVTCLAGLRQVLTGGEVLSPQHVACLRAAHPTLDIVNGYGPVESCVFATTHHVGAVQQDRDIPIGRPVADTDVRLVGGDGDPLADEPDEGEIWISGLGLADGYLGDPDRTAEAFVAPVPDGARWYRTGDLGRRDDEGLLHFAGRLDRQVKVRGARVQPEELEAVAANLLGCPCAVVPVPGRWSGYDRLALFVVGAAPEGPGTVRRQLAAQLPKHLVPDVVRFVPHLPTTPNGKVDTAGLLQTLTGTGGH